MSNPPASVPLARSISLAIREPGGERLLLVRRPTTDDELPGVWGLPAATLSRSESWEDAVVRAAREKLGVEVQVTRELNRGMQARPLYRLEMRLYEAALVAGEPRVPQPGEGVTQYSEWCWGSPAELQPAAELGSLCSQLMLEAGT